MFSPPKKKGYLIGYLSDLMDGLNPEAEIVEWHHQLNGHESEQTPGDSEDQGSLACCSPCGCRVGHDLVTEQKQEPKLDIRHCFKFIVLACLPRIKSVYYTNLFKRWVVSFSPLLLLSKKLHVQFPLP